MDKMDKPLSDWTLGEVRELCAGRSYCKGCPMAGAVCSIEKVVCPQEWDLTDKPRFTEEEMAVLRHMASTGIVSIDKKGKTYLFWDGGKLGGLMVVPPDFLPSLRPGQSVRLEDVLGGT